MTTTIPFEITSLHPRHFTITHHSSPQSSPSPTSELTSILTSILYTPPPSSFTHHGLFLGPTSLAYLLHRLSHLHPHLTISSHSLPSWAAWALSLPPPARLLEEKATKRGGIADELMATHTVSALLHSSTATAATVVRLARLTLDPRHCSSNEWLYGRAGTLYLLRALSTHFARNDAPASPQLTEVLADIEAVMDALCEVITSTPRPWTWHQKHYLGAAHGDVGIITQVVLSRPWVAPAVRADLLAVLGAQLESGNWPSSVPVEGSAEEDKLVQFCHGAPGVVVSLQSLVPFFPDLGAEMERAIERGRKCVVERGLLRKEACLCHGMAGNVMALGGGEEEEEGREGFYACMGEGVLEELVDRGVVLGWERSGVDLMGGRAGVAWAWGVKGTEMEGKMVGYNDL